MSTPTTSGGQGGEVARVREAYRRRTDGGLYSPLRADQVAITAARSRVWGAALARHDRRPRRVLEVGAGNGSVLRWAREVGAETAVGVDVLPERLQAGLAVNPSVGCVVADAQALPFPASAFDHVICSTLFSSILDDTVALRVAREIARVLDRDGAVLWFDFFRGNPANADVRAVGPRRLRQLFPGWSTEVERVVLAPPLARRLLHRPRVALLAEMLPPLRTHLAGLLERPRPEPPGSTLPTA